MKKILITSIFACIMLIVPITNVVSASDTVEDCNCNPISDSQVVRIERLLDSLESRINFILLKYGHIPEVEEKCEEILSIIDSWEPFDIICEFLERLMEFMWYMTYILPEQLWVLIFLIPASIVGSIWFFLCWLS